MVNTKKIIMKMLDSMSAVISTRAKAAIVLRVIVDTCSRQGGIIYVDDILDAISELERPST